MKRFLCVLTAAMLLVAAVAVAEGTVQPTAAPEEMTVEQKLYEMIPILDSFARNMGVEGEFPYDSANPEFVWMQLYLECVNWGSLNPEIALPDAQMTVPAQTMLAYAQASFSGLEALPEIPESVTGVTYDAMADAYLLDMSDMGETYVVIEKYAFDEAGNLIVGFGLYNPETGRLGGFSAQLVENAMLLDGTAGAFPYAVTGVANEPEGAFEGLTPTVCEIQYVEPTPEPTPMPTPVVYSELSLGSRGEAVMALQARLNELGYDCGTVDGIFGRATKEAVRYFQDAIGEDQDGVASNALQQKLFAANAPAFVLYKQLMSGSSGIRVEKLQNRLRALGYLALPVSGEFGSRTEEAVKVFQKQAGLKVDGIAGEKTLSALYSAKAKKCDTYITLKKGDTGTRVKEMQVRLRKLGFLTKKANSVYNSDTVKAVKAFIEEIGAEGDGKTADKPLLKKLFAYEPAPTATPTAEPTVEPTVEPTAEPTLEPTTEPTLEPTTEPTLEPTVEPTLEPTPEPTAEPTPEPVSVLTPEQQIAFTQAVNDALLPAIPYTDEEAVTWLQTALLIDPPTGIYDQATFDAVSALQLANSLLETGIADADVITILNVPPAP